jgi:hypothetical protein
MRGATANHGPIPWAAGERPTRTRVGIARWQWWSCKWIALLLLALVVLPWLPISRPPIDAARTRRARRVGDTAILTFAFAPHGETIATIQTDWRVALRDAAGGVGAHSFLDHPGPAWAPRQPDGRWPRPGTMPTSGSGTRPGSSGPRATRDR